MINVPSLCVRSAQFAYQFQIQAFFVNSAECCIIKHGLFTTYCFKQSVTVNVDHDILTGLCSAV